MSQVLEVMRILSIDTTTMLGSIALSIGDRLIVQQQQAIPTTHSEGLLLSIDHLIGVAGWDQFSCMKIALPPLRGGGEGEGDNGSLDHPHPNPPPSRGRECSRDCIEAVAFALGPGSFTGLRIGLATSKGISLAIGCPIAGVSSLKSLALNGRGFPGVVATLIDARRGEIYAAVWKLGQGTEPLALMEECVLPPDDLIKQLKEIKDEMLLVGDGAIVYGETIRKAIGNKVIIAEGSQLYPQAINLAILAASRLKTGGDDIASVAPNYVRRSDAEIGFRGDSLVL